MKKIFSLTLMCLALTALLSMVIQADEIEYPSSPVLDEYLKENIDNYFLPQGYDVRWCFSGNGGLDYFLDEYAHGRVSVPFVVICGNKEYHAEAPVYQYENIVNSELEFIMTDDMKRTFYMNNESAIRSFVAPWTLYNAKTGQLYTWNELISMSVDEIDALDFENPDFVKFITNVKPELEKRGWWKEEYEERYDLLNSHRADYQNSLDPMDNFIIDGVTYNFATLDYEYKTKVNQSIQNITCVNIHSNEFKEVYKSVSDDVKAKYSELFEAIGKKYNSKPAIHEYYGDVFGEPYMHYLIENIDSLSDEVKKEIQDKTTYELFEAYFNYGVSEEDIRKAAIKYNYTAAPWGKFETGILDAFFSAKDKKQAVEVFVSECGLLIDAEDFEIISVIELIDSNSYKFELTDRDEIERLIDEIKLKMYVCDLSEEDVKDDIEYLESLLEGLSPKTGDSTVLYLVISAAALASMTALLIRKKREVN